MTGRDTLLQCMAYKVIGRYTLNVLRFCQVYLKETKKKDGRGQQGSWFPSPLAIEKIKSH